MNKKKQNVPRKKGGGATDIFFIHGATSPGKMRRAIVSLVRAAKALRVLPAKTCVLSVSFVGSEEMKKLNGRFRGKEAPTDVLSFEQGSPGRAPKGFCFLGDIVICLPVARKQARERKHSLDIEILVLLAHGLLHLTGHDHERGGAREKRMRAIESKLLGRLKIRQNSGLLARGGV